MTLLENQARTIFLAALEQAPEQWPALLDQACGDNAALRVRVDELLNAHQALGNVHDGGGVNAVTLTIDQPTRQSSGSVIGPYKLLERLGEGGFGIVFVAEQTEPVRRKVALKVLKAGMDTRHVVARFEAERQALAIMDHPNIAKVFDGGATDSGRPYFVMELVKGVPITDFCDQNHLTPRQRLELFLSVCQAVQHAHQKGIIHRDLKPSNVLVSRHDTTPMVKVIDFGVAKALGQKLTDKTLFTGVAQMIGTPLYMSPEQAGMSELDVDTRSDIYSLGVLLYELLTGTTPFSKERFKKAAYDEIRRIIREEEPPKPSTRLSEATETLPAVSAQRHMEPAKLTRLVRGELDWIVMKALEKDRNRRYETANGFAMDLQRYLADEPVQACPPSAGYRFRKFARRNKKALVMTAAVAVIMLAATIISTWQAVRATRAEQKAVTNFDRATQAVKRMLTRVAQDELIDIPWMEPVRKALLEDALQFYEQLLAERSADPEVRLATAQAHIDLSHINGRYGDDVKREAEARLALELLEPLAKEFPENLRYRAGLAGGLHVQAHLTAWTPKRSKEAEQLLRRAVELQESVVSATPDSAENAYDLANMLHLLGNALRTGGQAEEAEAVYARVVSIGEQFTAKDPNHPAHLRAQVRGLTSTADMIRQKDPARAEGLLLHAHELAARFQAARRKTGFLFDTAADTVAQVDQILGQLYQETGRVKKAETAFRRAVATYKKYADDFPTLRHYRERLGWASTALAGSLSDPADREDAEQTWQQAIQIQEKLAAEFQKPVYRSSLCGTYRQFGTWLKAAGRVDEAEKAYRRALALAEKLVGDVPDDIEYRNYVAWSAENLGWILQEGARFDEAEPFYRQALRFIQPNAAEQPTDKKHALAAARVHRRLATVLRASGRREQALKHCEDLVAEFPMELEYRLLLTNVHHEIGLAAKNANKPDDAEQAFRRALQVIEATAAAFPKEPRAWEVMGHRARTLAWHLKESKRLAEVEKLLARGVHALATAAAFPEPGADMRRYWAAVTRRAQAEAVMEQGRIPEAGELLRKSIDDFAALPTNILCDAERMRSLTDCLNRYVGWLRGQRRPLDAVAVMQEGIDLYTRLHDAMPDAAVFRDARVEQIRKTAWFLATAPNPKIRDPDRALALAKKAVELGPEQGLCWNTLGVALYRTGAWKDAGAALEKSMELRKGGDSLDWFFLALTHGRLGDNEAARSWFERAVQWMEKNQPSNEELGRLRMEAATLLKVK
jgi:eukaryotic-like serine/threonine-protein kinase